MGKLIENLLPEDIIEEILYKLPLKSLLRLKCVSKRWRFMISCKRFAKEHLKKKSDDSNFSNHHRVLYSDYHCHYYAGSDSLRSIFHEPDSLGPSNLVSETNNSTVSKNSSFDLESLARATFRKFSGDISFRFFGSCNGLVLICMRNMRNSGTKKKVFIWNPTTRQAKKIPPPSFSNEKTNPKWRVSLLHGFGYDESTDDYKVVTISKLKPYQTQIFSSNTGSWKKIEFSVKSFRVICGSYGKLINGRLHWLVIKKKENNEKWDIVSFDLVDERYELVGWLEHLPDIATQPAPNVTDLSGHLSLICFTTNASPFKINIWVMMKYGEPQSWTKIWKLEDYVINGCIRHAMPLWLLKNGDLAVALGSDVFVYNGQDKLRKSPVRVRNCKIDCAIYFESLVIGIAIQG